MGGKCLTDDNLSDLTMEENNVGSHLTLVQESALHSKLFMVIYALCHKAGQMTDKLPSTPNHAITEI